MTNAAEQARRNGMTPQQGHTMARKRWAGVRAVRLAHELTARAGELPAADRVALMRALVGTDPRPRVDGMPAAYDLLASVTSRDYALAVGAIRSCSPLEVAAAAAVVLAGYAEATQLRDHLRELALAAAINAVVDTATTADYLPSSTDQEVSPA